MDDSMSQSNNAVNVRQLVLELRIETARDMQCLAGLLQFAFNG